LVRKIDAEVYKMLIAMVTIGQSPRTDVTSDIADILGPEIRTIECGALDELGSMDITKLKPRPNERLLVTRLRDGSEVMISHERVVRLVNDCISRVQDKANVVVFLCTGEFKEVRSNKLLIMPSDLLFRVVQSMLPRGVAGILVPSPNQFDDIRAKWKRKGLSLVLESLSPYRETDDKSIREIASRFVEGRADILVLDCIGYSRRISQRLKELTGLPTVLARTLVARVVREIL
jgi:protein AroM